MHDGSKACEKAPRCSDSQSLTSLSAGHAAPVIASQGVPRWSARDWIAEMWSHSGPHKRWRMRPEQNQVPS